MSEVLVKNHREIDEAVNSESHIPVFEFEVVPQGFGLVPSRSLNYRPFFTVIQGLVRNIPPKRVIFTFPRQK